MSELPARETLTEPIFSLSVNKLLAATLHGGDINFRFSAHSSALEGIRGHQSVQRSRPEGYRAEVAVNGEYRLDGLLLRLAGRIDGVYSNKTPVVIDEIKTLRVPISELPASVQAQHWGQVKLYGYLYSLEHDLAGITAQLSYLNLDSGECTEQQQYFDRGELQTFFESLGQRYLRRMAQVLAWRECRDQSINALDFPYGDFRRGQRSFAVSSYRAMAGANQLLVQAPTGTGKTVGTLFPGLKAMAGGHHQKLFFLTAKTSGREVAEQTLTDMGARGLRLKTVSLTAKAKICFNPGSPCDPEHCEFAVGYYDKLDHVLEQSLATVDRFDRQQIELIARQHTVCPFELSLDLANYADCIIGDYNYVFDPAVYLRRFFDEPDEAYGLLIDEAHNLVDRGRDMFSAELAKSPLMQLRGQLQRSKRPSLAAVIRRLEGVNRAFLALQKVHSQALEQHQHAVSSELPEALLQSLRNLCEEIQQWLADRASNASDTSEKRSDDDELLSTYFEALRFIRTADYFDSRYVCLLRWGQKNALSVKLYCVDPSKMLASGVQRGRSAVFFSATLGPVDYYRQLLGVAQDTAFVDLPSPFAAEKLGVYVIRDIATNYRQRGDSYSKIATLIADVTAAQRGNYLIFFPSYQYLQQVYQHFQQAYPQIATALQQPAMSELQRADFLRRFDADNTQSLVGFAVMGGVFAEGIDLVGQRLVGVVVVGVGLPQLGIDRDLIRGHFDQITQNPALGRGQGFEYAYQYPGMVRVLQTAGRVIRAASDRGIVCLVDDRFAQPRYRRLFPAHWANAQTIGRGQLAQQLAMFWDRQPGL